jgi:hypothetical protein
MHFSDRERAAGAGERTGDLGLESARGATLARVRGP